MPWKIEPVSLQSKAYAYTSIMKMSLSGTGDRHANKRLWCPKPGVLLLSQPTVCAGIACLLHHPMGTSTQETSMNTDMLATAIMGVIRYLCL